jgi:hypothetical protein
VGIQAGAYILVNTPPPLGGISANVIWGKKYDKWKRKGGKYKKRKRKKRERKRKKGKRKRVKGKYVKG